MLGFLRGFGFGVSLWGSVGRGEIQWRDEYFFVNEVNEARAGMVVRDVAIGW